MKKKICKTVIFVILTVVIFLGLTNIFMAKFLDNNCQSYTAAELYEQPKNSIEVVFSGSSQMVFGISSMKLYEDYGISAYGTGSPNQGILCSLGWLREIDKTQDIKVAVLDASQLFETIGESDYRQTLDTMKLSANKLDIVQQHIEETNRLLEEGSDSGVEQADSMLSYIFPIIKYHTRWEELTKDDFTFSTDNSPMFMGTRMADYVTSFTSYEEWQSDESEMSEEDLTMTSYQKDSLLKYKEYCDENGIEMLLIKTPKSDWTETKDRLTQELADELGITYINYSSKEQCEALGIDFHSDFKDSEHQNVRGMDKMAEAVGAYLNEHYDLTDFRESNLKDEAYLESYHEARDMAYVLTEGNVADFLTTINSDYLPSGSYDIVLELTDDSILPLWTDEMQAALESCGFQTDLRTLEGKTYVAARIANGETEEQTGEKRAKLSGKLGDGLAYSIEATRTQENAATPTFTLNGAKRKFSGRGLNILFYESDTNTILDTATVMADEDGTLKIFRPIENRHQ
jgi:hypothetical protein